MHKNLRKINLQIRMDETTHAQIKYIANKELRSFNSQMTYFLAKGIDDYEKENGTIPSRSDAPEDC